ncbi:MAG: hypothetical protein AAGK04_08995, partial [Planctomycetota bacterium]
GVGRHAQHGTLQRGALRTLPGWRAITPITSAPGELWPDRALMRSLDGATIALWAIPDGSGPLEMAWEREYGAAQTELVWWNADAAWMLTRPVAGVDVNRRVGGWSLERLSLETGDVVWRIGTFESFFGGIPATGLPDASGGAATLRSSIEGSVPLGDVLVTGDGRTLAIVERTGRVASVDLLTGRVLWAWRGPVRRVFDAVLENGRLALAGLVLPPGPRHAGGDGADPGPLLAVYDARTGEEAHRPAGIDRDVGWLRGADGALLVGLDDRVVSIDLVTGRENFVSRDDRFGSSGAAWVAGQRLYSTTSGRWLAWMDIGSGQVSQRQIEASGRINPIDSVRVHEVGERVVLASASGALFLDERGELDAVDALGIVSGLTRSALALTEDGRALVLAAEMAFDPEVNGVRTFGLYALNAETGQIELAERLDMPTAPVGVRVLNGRVLIDTRLGTVSAPFPLSDGGEP